MIQVKPDNSDKNDPKIILTINNGDLAALNDTLNSYGFVDYEALLRYALVALLRTEDNRLYIKENGGVVKLNPSDKLFKPQDGGDAQEAETES